MGNRALVILEGEGVQFYTHWHSERALPDAVRFAITQDLLIFNNDAYELETLGGLHTDLDFPEITVAGSTIRVHAAGHVLPLPAQLLGELLLPVCQWFAMCGNPATYVQLHPVLGRVPICKRCLHIANGEEPYP